MGSAQGLLLRELGSHIFHGSSTAPAGVLRAAHFRSARIIAIVVATELDRVVCLALACRAARPAHVSAEQQRAAAAMPCIALPCELTFVCPFACRRIGNADEPGSQAQRARLHESSRSAAASPHYGVSSSSRAEVGAVVWLLLRWW